jgi:hypothetical protein
VERREALRPTLLGAHGWRYQLCGVKRLLHLKGAPLCASGASRRSISLARFARDWQSSDALRRENATTWLFEILKGDTEDWYCCVTKGPFPGSLRALE